MNFTQIIMTVTFNQEKSKRNQLWRMTGSGMLEHEGSMPPRDPRNPTATSEPGLVLDIADLAPRPGQCVPLILRKPDVRRRSTQTWRFTEVNSFKSCSVKSLLQHMMRKIFVNHHGANDMWSSIKVKKIVCFFK